MLQVKAVVGGILGELGASDVLKQHLDQQQSSNNELTGSVSSSLSSSSSSASSLSATAAAVAAAAVGMGDHGSNANALPLLLAQNHATRPPALYVLQICDSACFIGGTCCVRWCDVERLTAVFLPFCSNAC